MSRSITSLLAAGVWPLPVGEASPDSAAWWMESLPAWLRPWFLPGLIGLLSLLILWRIARAITRWLRRRRPAQLHPKLAKYNIDHAELDRHRRSIAGQIMATSTGSNLAGFRIVRQVEAVFVEGYRTPEEAVIALKAAAAERGANALLNVGTQRTAAGRCTASGDAVVAVPERTDAEPLSGPPGKIHNPPHNPT